MQLFHWYRPKDLAQNANHFETSNKSTPFEQETIDMITDRHRNRGCTPFLTDAFSPPIALNTDDVSQIVPSCLVPQNFEIQVLSLGKMTSAIIEKFADSEGKAI